MFNTSGPGAASRVQGLQAPVGVVGAKPPGKFLAILHDFNNLIAPLTHEKQTIKYQHQVLFNIRTFDEELGRQNHGKQETMCV